MKNMMCILGFVVPVVSLNAGTIELPRTAKPQFADMESATNVAVTAFAEAGKSVTVTIECDTAKDNAMRVFVGKDANKDGTLGLEEIGLRFGWDAGQWIVDELDGQNHLEVVSETSMRTASANSARSRKIFVTNRSDLFVTKLQPNNHCLFPRIC